MSKISLSFALALMLVTGLTGLGFGYFFTPEYQLSMYEKNTMDLGRPDRRLDLRYLNAMIAHHRGAIHLAEQAEKSERPEVVALAQEIQKNEPVLIAELVAWKKEWYGDIRPVRDPVSPKLGKGDAQFDLRFLNALIAHHEAGIVMTQDVRHKSSRSEVLNNADAVEAFLSGSAKQLRDWRQAWYNVN